MLPVLIRIIKNININKAISFILLITFPAAQVMAQPISFQGANNLGLPPVGTMISTTSAVEPALIKGIKIFPDNPLRFDFIVDAGNVGANQRIRSNKEGDYMESSVRKESEKLIKYFLASLTVPEEDLWVNLSPNEPDRIIPHKFGETEMGRDLLAQDYILKQLTASLMYPEDELGEEFWDRVHEEAYKKYGTSNISMDTFNKVWIVPEKAVVYENAETNTAFVVESKLKVMMEEDYTSFLSPGERVRVRGKKGDSITTPIVREIILPRHRKGSQRRPKLRPTSPNLPFLDSGHVVQTQFKKICSW